MRCDLVPLVRRSVVLALAFVFASCTNDNSPMQPTANLTYVTPTGLLTANPPQIFLGAGDISSCSNSGDEQTAQLLDAQPVGTVFNIGDDAYENGTNSEFNCYHATWGRHKARTKPTPGNHEYNTSGASGYFNYFGSLAGPGNLGYYSFNLGAWHIISLNSNVSSAVGSAQRNWLVADLAANPNMCTMAYFHHPLYSSTSGSGSGGAVYTGVRQMYNDLYAAHVDLVLGGHRHFYERLAPMKPDGTSDPVNGLRQLIVGTGGIGGGTLTNLHPRSEVRNGATFGIIKLYLYDDSYAFKFIPVAGKTFTDSGSAGCHSFGGGGGGVSASNSAVGASPTSFTAGTGSSTITVTVRDGSNNPISGASVVFAATGTGNTFTPTNATTNGSGVATSTLTSTGAGTKTVSATASGTTINQQPTVTVNPGPVSAAVSTVSANPSSFVAGSGSSTITVTAKDANGNTISGLPVSVASTGSGNTLTPASGATNGSGVFTSVLTSTTAELKTVSATINSTPITQTAAVNVTSSGGGGGTISHALLTAGSSGTNLSTYTTASISPLPNALITVAVRNHRSSAAISPTLSGGGMTSWTQVTSVDYDPVSGSLGRLTVFRAMSAAPGSGPITIQFSNSVSNVDWIVSQWTGVDQSGANGSGAIGQIGAARGDAVSFLSVPLAPFGNPNNVAYGAVGAKLNAGVTPGSGFTEIAEVTPQEATLLEAQWATNLNTVSATLTTAKNAALLAIELKAGAPSGPVVSPSQSSVSATSPITAGSGSSTITVTARDGSGNPISGATVVLAASGTGNTLTQPVGTTAANGTITGSLSSTKSENKTISATINGVAINQQPTVTVNPGAAAALVYTTQPSNTAAGAPISPAVVVDIRDAFNNHVNSNATVAVAIGTNPGSGTLSGSLSQGASAGVATFSDLSINNIANGYTLVASSTGLTSATSTPFNITPPVPSASLSTVVAGTPSFTAGGNSNITVTVKDGFGNAMTGVTVTLSSSVVGDVVTQPSAVTNGSGQATGNVAATAAGTHTITAVAGGITLNQQPVLTVSAGAANAGTSTVSANPTTITAGGGSSTITVTVRDQYSNPVSGATVVLGATGTGNTFGQPGATGSNGVTTGTISSSDPQTENVTATANGVLITQQPQLTVSAPSSGITHTLLTVGTNTVNQTVYTTASISPAPNTLITVAVLGHRAYGAVSPTLSGGGMSTWTQVASVDFDVVGTPLRRLTVFRAMSAAPGSGPLTITFSGNVSNVQWIVSQWNGVDQSGTNGAGAIVQASSAAADAVNGLTKTLAAFGSANNVAYGVFGVNSNVLAITPGAGFTELAEQPSGESTPGDLFAEWAVNSPAISATWTSKHGAVLGIEIKAGP